MKIGVVFPQTEFGQDPAALRDYAQTAEALGYSHILTYEHVLGANPDRPGGWHGPYTYQHSFFDPFVMYSYLGINPFPVRQPIPIWLGGHADAVLRRVAKMGDGWFPNYRTPEQARPSLAKLDGYLAEHGRSRADIGIEARIYYDDGNPDKWQQTLNGWQAAGVTHVTVNTMGYGFDTAVKHINAIRAFAEIIPSPLMGEG